VTAGPGAFIGRGAFGAAERGGILVLALRRFGAAFFALRAGFRAADFLRAGAARLFDLAAFFALRFFAMMSS
jgi:hypothetical protein